MDKKDKTLDGLKKLMYAGIGGVAITGEKLKEVLDEMAEKGEQTVAQGKVLNEELKHNIKKTVKENVNVSVKANTPDELNDLIDKMTPEQLEILRSKLSQMEETGESEESEEEATEDVDE